MSNPEYFNPFPGLRAFEQEEEFLFFGREQQVDKLLQKLEKTHFLAVVGASGSGKSSLVKSGLLPSFHSGFVKGVGRGWRIGVFKPGDNPIGNLAECFCGEELINDIEDEYSNRPIIETTLRRSEDGINQVVDQFLRSVPENILLVVDQFEELFRFSKYEKRTYRGERDSVVFINLLLAAIKDISKRVFVVITMRSDFLGNCTEFRGLPEAINKGQYLIPRLTREEKKLAVTGPIAVGGGSITPRLLTMVLNEVGDNPDQLPILQHALMRTWDYWTKQNTPDEPIDVKHYEAVGKMQSALSMHADEAYLELADDEERLLCEKMFKALTEIGTNQGGIRRPTVLKELVELTESNKERLISIIEVFRAKGRTFLMPPVSVDLDADTVIDISHESLMRVWKRLDAWVKAEAESADTYKSISTAAALYQEGKGGLYRDPELQLATQWRGKTNPNEAWALRYDPSFVRAMNFLDESEKQYNFEIEQKEKAQKNKVKKARRINAVLGLAFFVSLIFAVFAVLKSQEATENLEIAESKKTEAENQRAEAERQKLEADNQRILADLAKADAISAKDEAEIARDDAKEAEKDALTQKQIAENERAEVQRQKLEADNQRILADLAKADAEKSEANAKDSEREAIIARNKAEDLKNQSDARTLALEALNLLNQNKVDSARKVIVEADKKNKEGKGPSTFEDLYIASLNAFYSSDSSFNHILREHNSAVRNMAYHPTKDYLLSVEDKNDLIVSSISTKNGIELKHVETLPFKPRVVEFNENGNLILVGSATGELLKYQFSEGDPYLKLIASSNIGGIIQKISFQVIDAFEYTFISGTNGLKIYDMENGLGEIETEGLPANLTFVSTFNSDFLVGAIGENIVNYKISLYEEKIKFIANESIPLGSKISMISSVDKNQTFYVGTVDGNVYELDFSGRVPSRKKIHTFLSDVTALKSFYNGSGPYLIASSLDNTILLMNLDDTQEKVVINSEASGSWVYDVVPSFDGESFFSAGNDKTVRFWFVQTNKIIDELSNN
jgi:energy-coupling factor transporter ATP-binding protein EcfA2